MYNSTAYSALRRNPISRQTRGEEIANCLTHGIGAALGVAGLVLLVVYSALAGSVRGVVAFSVYGATLILLYLMSTVYHSVRSLRWKAFFQVMDHVSIYFLIAGSYTPLMLIAAPPAWGWSLFGVLWGLALLGVVFKIFFTGRFDLISTLIYLFMGWIIVFFFYPVMMGFPGMGIAWLFIGGACYSLGTVFYLWEGLPFHHSLWHLFVLGGSISHFFCFFLYLIPR